MPALYLRGNRLTEMHIKLAAYVSEENRLTEIRVILWQLRLTPCVKSYFTAVKTRIWVEAREVKENMRSNERLSCPVIHLRRAEWLVQKFIFWLARRTTGNRMACSVFSSKWKQWKKYRTTGLFELRSHLWKQFISQYAIQEVRVSKCSIRSDGIFCGGLICFQEHTRISLHIFCLSNTRTQSSSPARRHRPLYQIKRKDRRWCISIIGTNPSGHPVGLISHWRTPDTLKTEIILLSILCMNCPLNISNQPFSVTRDQ